MTLNSLYLEYCDTYKILRGRINELKACEKQTGANMSVRIKPLESMCRDVRETCKSLNNYYKKKRA